MFRKTMLTAVAAMAVTAVTAGAASAQVSLGVWFGAPRACYRPYPVFARPVAVAQPVPEAPPVLAPPLPAAPPVTVTQAVPCAPVAAVGGQQDFLLLHPARSFANAMSAQGYQVRLQSHGLRWRVVYTLPVIR